MKNTLAIFFENFEIDKKDSLYSYIVNNYIDFFYITDAITIKNVTNTPVLHYTDIRMREIDVLITDIRDVHKVYGLHNSIILYYSDIPKTIDISSTQHLDLINKIDRIIFNNTIDEKIITEVLSFTGEKTCINT